MSKAKLHQPRVTKVKPPSMAQESQTLSPNLNKKMTVYFNLIIYRNIMMRKRFINKILTFIFNVISEMHNSQSASLQKMKMMTCIYRMHSRRLRGEQTSKRNKVSRMTKENLNKRMYLKDCILSKVLKRKLQMNKRHNKKGWVSCGI